MYINSRKAYKYAENQKHCLEKLLFILLKTGLFHFSKKRLELGQQCLLLPHTALGFSNWQDFPLLINLMEFPIQLIS